jgi:diketogulonate reductase-like aldo/keto reductase
VVCPARHPVTPKSTHRERIAENAQVFDFDLAADDMDALDGLDRTGRTRARSSAIGGERIARWRSILVRDRTSL